MAPTDARLLSLPLPFPVGARGPAGPSCNAIDRSIHHRLRLGSTRFDYTAVSFPSRVCRAAMGRRLVFEILANRDPRRRLGPWSFAHRRRPPLICLSPLPHHTSRGPVGRLSALRTFPPRGAAPPFPSTPQNPWHPHAPLVVRRRTPRARGMGPARSSSPGISLSAAKGHHIETGTATRGPPPPTAPPMEARPGPIRHTHTL